MGDTLTSPHMNERMTALLVAFNSATRFQPSYRNLLESTTDQALFVQTCTRLEILRPCGSYPNASQRF
jgi:hypothetical protein